MKRPLLLTALLFAAASLTAAEPPITDDFTEAERPDRRLTRGEWTMADGAVSCTQDDALYEKYKQHGPVIWYDVDFTDAVIRFSYWADESVQTFVFTINGADGHVFRFVLKPRPGMIKAFARDGEPVGLLTRDAPKLAVGEWVDVAVTLKGDTSLVKIGDFTHEGTHPAIDQAKTTIGLGFSFGTMKFRDMSVQ